MTHTHHSIQCQTQGRGFYEITSKVTNLLSEGLASDKSLCHLFIHHTSASLLITENADPEVLTDLEGFFSRLIPDGDPLFRHVAEGADDMPAHVRSALTQTSLTVPIQNNRLALGTWQGIFLWEHRHAGHTRKVTVSFVG